MSGEVDSLLGKSLLTTLEWMAVPLVGLFVSTKAIPVLHCIIYNRLLYIRYKHYKMLMTLLTIILYNLSNNYVKQKCFLTLYPNYLWKKKSSVLDKK